MSTKYRIRFSMNSDYFLSEDIYTLEEVKERLAFYYEFYKKSEAKFAVIGYDHMRLVVYLTDMLNDPRNDIRIEAIEVANQ